MDGWDGPGMVGGNVISDPNPAERKTPVGDGRVARVLLDPAQYHQVRWKNLKMGDDWDDPKWLSMAIRKGRSVKGEKRWKNC